MAGPPRAHALQHRVDAERIEALGGQRGGSRRSGQRRVLRTPGKCGVLQTLPGAQGRGDRTRNAGAVRGPVLFEPPSHGACVGAEQLREFCLGEPESLKVLTQFDGRHRSRVSVDGVGHAAGGFGSAAAGPATDGRPALASNAIAGSSMRAPAKGHGRPTASQAGVASKRRGGIGMNGGQISAVMLGGDTPYINRA